MKILVKNKKVLAALIIIGLVSFFFWNFPFTPILGVIGLGAGLQFLRITESERNSNALSVQNIQSILGGYEEIIDGKLWSGKDAEILAANRVDDRRKSGPVIFEYICRTKNGAWFLLDVGVICGRVAHLDLNPCDEATAKRRLERHKDVYVHCFGQPKNA